jgi:hypothetical protein
MRQNFVEPGIPSAPPAEQVRAELDLVLASGPFVRSERHSAFLRFVCETTLNGNAAKLNEYLIAHEVFGRGPGYSPGEDSVVRRQAHSLRQKLHDYYSGQGKHNPVRIDLPVGRYVPVFVRVEDEAVPAEEPVRTAPAGVPIRLAIPPAWSMAAGVAAALLLLLGGWELSAWYHRPSAGARNWAANEIWGPWFADPAGAVICFSNPMTAVVKQFPAPLPPNAQPPRIPVTPEQAEQFRAALDLPPGGYLYLSPAITQSKTGETIGSITLATMLTRAGIPVRATQSRFLSWDDFRSENLILLGHDEANRWLDPILSKLPIHLAASEGDKHRRIVNSAAAAGQRSEYSIQFANSKDQVSVDYALISMLKGIDGRHKLLLVNGLNTEGTQRALEYLCDPATQQILVAALRGAAPNHHGAWQFQAILSTEVRDKVPTRADLLALKVL